MHAATVQATLKRRESPASGLLCAPRGVERVEGATPMLCVFAPHLCVSLERSQSTSGAVPRVCMMPKPPDERASRRCNGRAAGRKRRRAMSEGGVGRSVTVLDRRRGSRAALLLKLFERVFISRPKTRNVPGGEGCALLLLCAPRAPGEAALVRVGRQMQARSALRRV